MEEEKFIIKGEQFEELKKEAIRQFEQQDKILERHTNMAQVIIGFVTAFILYVLLNRENYELFSKSFWGVAFFSSSILFIVSSGVFGFLSYQLKKFTLGSSVLHLISLLRGGVIKDVRPEILNRINLANSRNRLVILEKSFLIKLSYVLYAIGFFLFISIKFIYSFWI